MHTQRGTFFLPDAKGDPRFEVRDGHRPRPIEELSRSSREDIPFRRTSHGVARRAHIALAVQHDRQEVVRRRSIVEICNGAEIPPGGKKGGEESASEASDPPSDN